MFDNLINQTGISIERLAVLCEIASAGSIGAAAAGNANRQSQFSRQIAELEAFFGCELLDRRARPFRLNEEGRELAQLARSSLGGLDEFLARTRGGKSRIVIGAGESLIQWVLLPRALKHSSESTVFVFKNLDTTRIIEGLQSGQIDAGIVRSNAVPEGCQIGASFEYRYRLFMPKALMPRAKSTTCPPLASLPLAMMEGRGEMRRALEGIAESRGDSLWVRLECSSYPQIATAVASGLCAGVLPYFAHQFLPAAVIAFDLPIGDSLALMRKVTLVWPDKTERVKPCVRDTAALLNP